MTHSVRACSEKSKDIVFVSLVILSLLSTNRKKETTIDKNKHNRLAK